VNQEEAVFYFVVGVMLLAITIKIVYSENKEQRIRAKKKFNS
jgi:hypothetical protein